MIELFTSLHWQLKIFEDISRPCGLLASRLECVRMVTYMCTCTQSSLYRLLGDDTIRLILQCPEYFSSNERYDVKSGHGRILK